jgi:ribonuclease VapC
MVVDTSALVAIVCQEPGHSKLLDIITAPFQDVFISAPTLVESSLVIDFRPSALGQSAAELCALLKIEVISFDPSMVEIARSAYQRYGKGTDHPAQLNFGDCFSYALAKSRDDTLLFVGSDFAQTDLRPANVT